MFPSVGPVSDGPVCFLAPVIKAALSAALAQVLAAGTDLASEETVQQITHLLKSIPPEALAGVPPEHHALVQSVIQGQRES